MHVTPWKQDVESCDRVGLMQAMPAGDSEKDVDGRRWEQRVEVMRDAIIYNRNNPSIIFYESGNKGISRSAHAEMKALRDKYDPHGGRASGSREMLDSNSRRIRRRDALHQQERRACRLWAMEYSRDEGLRKYWDEFSPPFHKDGDGPLYNGQNAATTTATRTRTRSRTSCAGSTTGASGPAPASASARGGVNIIFSDSNTHHRGAENYRRSGEVDAMRIPKDGYFADQVMWDGWVDVEKPRTHIIGHWNYAPGTRKNVYVVSSADKVELFVNGSSKGFGEQSSRFLFTFKNVEWQPGELKAVGYDAAGKEVCRRRTKTAGEPVAIRLTPHTGPDGLQGRRCRPGAGRRRGRRRRRQPLPDRART